MPTFSTFDAHPRILPADQESTIRLTAKLGQPALADGRYSITVYASEELGADAGETAVAAYTADVCHGALTFSHFFLDEQEHAVILTLQNSDEVVGEARVYSLQPDLFQRRPLKGDVHMHSNRSDGRDEPAAVAAACRTIGLDFMALTDHRLYQPSIESQEAFADVTHDLLICRGEEVHPPGNITHMINFGGDTSVNDMFRDDAYLAGVGQIVDALGELPAGVDAYSYASCVWCFRQIREHGGLGIFCHPYWYTRHRYEPAGALTTHLFSTQPYDAFELIGGYHPFEFESNWLQVARYHDERAKGREIPIVGISDAHGCYTGELFGWFYTIAFSPEPTQPAIIDAIRDLYSVAIEHLPGQEPRAHGPFRLVKFAQYLMREAMPEHDRLARIEGEWMLRHIEGDSEAATRLAELSGQCEGYWDRLWAE